MPLSEYQLKRCLEVMDKLKRRKISELFLEPIDQAFDNLPENYSQKITKMIDLSIVRENLVNGIYNTINDWKNDVNIIWENFFNIFTINEPQYLCAKELQESFNNLSELISDNPTSDWESQLSILKDNFLTLSKNGPKSIFGDEGVSLPLDSTSGSSTSSSKKKSSSSRNKKKQPTTASNTAPESFGKSLPDSYQQTNSSAQPTLDLPIETHQNDDSSNIDITKLQDDINNVADDDNMPEMMNIIRQNEAAYQNNESDEVEVDLQLLSNKTLHLLRNYIDTLLKETKSKSSEN